MQKYINIVEKYKKAVRAAEQEAESALSVLIGRKCYIRNQQGMPTLAKYKGIPVICRWHHTGRVKDRVMEVVPTTIPDEFTVVSVDTTIYGTFTLCCESSYRPHGADVAIEEIILLGSP